MAMIERTSSETIFQACIGLRNEGRLITRQVLAKVTSLKMGIVDDHVTRLAEHGRLRRVSNGVVELVEQFPANRPISKTVLPDGSVKIEVGDDLVCLTPGEAQVVGGMLLGEATQFAQLRGDRDQQDKVAKLQRDLEELQRRLHAQTREIVRLRQQPELAFE